jgi:uncharacterized protein
MDYTNREQNVAGQSKVTYNEGLRTYMLKVYNFMCLALLVTGFVASMAASSPALMSMLFGAEGQGITGLGFVIVFAPLAFVMVLSFGITKMSYQTAQMVFWAYAAVMGLSLSTLFVIYTGESIARVFFITSSIFGAMSLYGYTTKRDLTGMGSFLMMGLFGVIIASIVNIFLKSAGMLFITSILTVIIFVGLTAYNTQNIKRIYAEVAGNAEQTGKAALMGALSLYLDFINIFITLLRLFGDRRG